MGTKERQTAVEVAEVVSGDQGATDCSRSSEVVIGDQGATDCGRSSVGSQWGPRSDRLR